jgi:hypothetical protein
MALDWNPAPRVPARRAVVRKLQLGDATEPPLSGEQQPRGARVCEAAQARRAQLPRPEVQRRPEKQTTTQRHQSAVPGIPQGAEGPRGSAERRRRLKAIGVGSLRGCQSVSAVLVSAAPLESRLRTCQPAAFRRPLASAHSEPGSLRALEQRARIRGRPTSSQGGPRPVRVWRMPTMVSFTDVCGPIFAASRRADGRPRALQGGQYGEGGIRTLVRMKPLTVSTRTPRSRRTRPHAS